VVEHSAHNGLVVGSIPTMWITFIIKYNIMKKVLNFIIMIVLFFYKEIKQKKIK
jgi:hypothetical protein